MANVLLVAYLLIVLALIIVILLQRSEGGALGIGGGGGGGLMTARGSANLLTRTTAILAVLFFASAIGLTILNDLDRTTTGILDSAITAPGDAAPSTVLDALNALQGDLPLPVEAQTPAAPETTSGDLPVPMAPAETELAPPADTMMMAPAPEAPAAESQTPSTPTGN
ncbi:preprotein translocase subunit SecG [Devosia sp. YIM 151766]|uniref:preprotein translocase subunit SecG n=1 Tax=Devosia sp. YIM 151766 TaxID=3017325 RepID=UPI00255C94D2|nr:preprotein translocase subunit SecG [Devosia sp. YIM 151766]WIY54315.1 preprotein translocase subunit SecG [Devosia sp. YIM 151766]